MSELETKIDAPPVEAGDASDVKARELAAMLGTALPDFKCLACGNPSVSLINQPDLNLDTTLSLYGTEHVFSDYYIRTISVACNNCGFISSFVREAIEELARKNTALPDRGE